MWMGAAVAEQSGVPFYSFARNGFDAVGLSRRWRRPDDRWSPHGERYR
jgi:hypothetical protein